ncbi:hypothetical protein [Leclercia adecarboxylata]|uniref:hypothetical protein n=1 Tax=Leclercia adecarboxylata TaxID=83655 RepID=UPI001F066AC4|nr:hypothetical protein [Leclercia adecarboxylata]MCH2680408.1 hypothetical protein [Leclercia adecarboxylata]
MKHTPEEIREIEINMNRKVSRIARHFIFYQLTDPQFEDPIFECNHSLYNRVLIKIQEYIG